MDASSVLIIISVLIPPFPPNVITYDRTGDIPAPPPRAAKTSDNVVNKGADKNPRNHLFPIGGCLSPRPQS